MEIIEQLDTDINDLHARIATLHAHRANLNAVLLSQPHLSTRLSTHDKAGKTTLDLIAQQSKRNVENVYRACAGVTAYKVKDPDPHAVNNGSVLGVSISVFIGNKFVETYHVLLNWKERDGEKVLRIHKHTIPPCIALQQLASKWLPVGGKDIEDAASPEQDLVKFGKLLRKELVSWHMRMKTVEDLRKEAGLAPSRTVADRQEVSLEPTGRILNAFMSDGEDEDTSSDTEEPIDEENSSRILDIEADAAVRQITITWSDRRTAIMSITKDGRVEKAVNRTKDGGRDVALSRKAIGPLAGLVRRLTA